MGTLNRIMPRYRRKALLIQLGEYWCIWINTPWWSLGLHAATEPLFSERYGYSKAWRALGLQIHYRPVTPTPNGDRYERLERKHLGDPDKRTGIYADPPK